MYRVKLTEFEGPLDLLLFFIRRDELDIEDIPISKITKDFFEMRNLNSKTIILFSISRDIHKTFFTTGRTKY